MESCINSLVDSLIFKIESGEINHWDECGEEIVETLSFLSPSDYDNARESVKFYIKEEFPRIF